MRLDSCTRAVVRTVDDLVVISTMSSTLIVYPIWILAIEEHVADLSTALLRPTHGRT